VRAALILAASTAACVTASASLMTAPAIGLLVPAKRVEAGSGTIDPAAVSRIEMRAKVALAEATRDALEAANTAPADLRLQRRAAAMMRSCAGDKDAKAKLAELAPDANRTLEHLVALAPCPGLVDAAATWVAFGDNAKGGEAYVAAASQCDNPEAAVAAVGPLHAVDKCDEALVALRAAWPHVHGAKARLGIDILDGVTACSDELTLRRNLAFVPTDVLQGYLTIVEERARQEREAQQRAEQQQRDQEARDRAWQASSQCRSECSAAVSSCESSCSGDSGCTQSCSSVGHVCNSGCGSY
jgi:hypothetical protein